MRVRELIAAIERLADPGRAASWDRSGVQIAGTLDECRRLAVTLDPLPGLVEQALGWGAECLLVHHPLTLTPRLPDRLDDYHRVLGLVLGRGAWLYAAHTSLDVRVDGPAGWLADALNLRDRRLLEPAGRLPHVQTRLRAPSPEDRDRCLATLAGREGCQALALGSDLLEITHANTAWPDIETALGAVSGLIRLSSLDLAVPADRYGYGLVGALPEPLSMAGLRERLWRLLPRTFLTQAGDEPEQVTTLAYCPGSGADMAPRAFAAGAEVFVTGDLKYHQATAVPRGRLIVDVGHFSLEEVMMRVFARELATALGPSGPQTRFFPGNDPFSAHFPEGDPAPRTEETLGEQSCI
jgi:dinuclear metal center YbgI/SA1388 family protein